MVSGVIVASPNSDVILRNVEVNTPIARKRYAPRKQSLVHSKGNLKSSLRVCSQTFTFIALILAIVISVLGGLCNKKTAQRKSTIGTSSSLSTFEPLVAISFRDSLFLSILQEFSATIIGINEGLCSCINKGTFLNNNKQLIRRMEVLHNTIMCEEGGYVYPGYATCELATFAKRTFWRENVWLHIQYIPARGLLGFPCIYFDTYTVNLELDDNFKVFFDLVYLYIYLFYRSWSSCNWAAYPEAILVKIYTLVYFSSKMIVLVIKSHDEYQSLILIGLARAEKASSRNRSVLDHYRSYWREW